jgi:hypothetical protein
MTIVTEAAIKAADEALKYHRMRLPEGKRPRCACGWTTPEKFWADDHRLHVAGVALAVALPHIECSCPHISEADDYCPQHGRDT